MGMTLTLDFLKSIKLPLASKSSQASSVCLYSPSASVFYEYSKQTIRPVTTPNPKSNFISFIQLEDLLLESVDINKFLEGPAVYEALELKLFDELGLKPSLEYKICYEEADGAEEGFETKKYNAYIATYQAIRQRISPISDRYVDFVFLPQTAIKTLFTKNFLSDSSTFAFIYLYADSACLCVYQNGNYTYSKTIRASIKILSEKLSEHIGERIGYEDFVKIITNSEFRVKKPEYIAGFKTLIGEFFASVSEVLVHAKRVNQISGYEAIYISTEHGNIADITEIAKEYFETPFKNFDFNLGIKTEGFVDMSTKLMLFAYLQDLERYEHLNFSIFMRPPPFFKRYAGKFMLTATASLLLSFAYPLYNMTAADFYYSFATRQANKELATLKAERQEIESKKTAAQKEQEELTKKSEEQTKKYSDTIAMLKDLESKKLGAKSVSTDVAKISSTASNSNVLLRSVDINATDIKIECSAKDPTLISGFAKKLWLGGQNNLSADKIVKEGNVSKYIGEISVKVGK